MCRNDFRLLAAAILLLLPPSTAQAQTGDWCQVQTAEMWFSLEVTLELPFEKNRRGEDRYHFEAWRDGVARAEMRNRIRNLYFREVPHSYRRTDGDLIYRFAVSGKVRERQVELRFTDLRVDLSVAQKHRPNQPILEKSKTKRRGATDINGLKAIILHLAGELMAATDHTNLVPPHRRLKIPGTFFDAAFRATRGELVVEPGRVSLRQRGQNPINFAPSGPFCSVVSTPLLGPQPSLRLSLPDSSVVWFRFIDTVPAETAAARCRTLLQTLRQGRPRPPANK